MYTESNNNKTRIKAQYYPVDLHFKDEPYTSPERAAELIVHHENAYTEASQYIEQLALSASNNAVVQELRAITARSLDVVHKLSSISYVALRHIISQGFTLHDIAEGLQVNVLDLQAYMSSHPEADKHAEIDFDNLADALHRKMVKELKDMPMNSKYESDKMKTLLLATEMQIKRLSANWVGKYRAGNEEGGPITAGMTVNMQIGQINNNTQNNYSQEQQEAAAQLKQYNQDLAIQDADALSLDAAQQALTIDVSPEDLAQSLKEEAQDREAGRKRRQTKTPRRDYDADE